jgi:hypothetical protein
MKIDISFEIEMIIFHINGPSVLWESHIIMKYPSWMKNLVAHDINGEDRQDPVDIATLESNPFHASLALHYFYFYLFILAKSIILDD